MTKKDLAQRSADDLGITAQVAKEAIQKTLGGILETLCEDGRVEFRNFGVFTVKKRKARTARNPRTGEKVDVPEKCIVTFKPGKEMEAEVGSLKEVPGKQVASV